jgi:hypothetical protein
MDAALAHSERVKVQVEALVAVVVCPHATEFDAGAFVGRAGVRHDQIVRLRDAIEGNGPA